MNQGKKIWKTNSLSYLFSKAKEGMQMRTVSKYWFSGILSAADELDLNNFEEDLEKSEIYNMLSILNIAFADLIGFSQKEPSESIFKLLEIMRKILKINHYEGQTEMIQSYRIWMFKLHFLNTLGIFSMKNKQFMFAISCYEQIFQIYENGPLDTINEIFLVSLSNYIICLKNHDQIIKDDKI